MSSMVSLVPMDKAVAADETGVVANVVELILQWLVELIFSNGWLISNSYIAMVGPAGFAAMLLRVRWVSRCILGCRPAPALPRPAINQPAGRDRPPPP